MRQSHRCQENPVDFLRNNSLSKEKKFPSSICCLFVLVVNGIEKSFIFYVDVLSRVKEKESRNSHARLKGMLRDDLVVANAYRVERINVFSVMLIDHCFVGELFDQLQIDHWDQTLSVPFKANSPRNSSFSRARTQRVFTRRSTRKGNFKASDCATLLLRFNEEREKKDGKQIVVSKCITCCCCKVQAIRIWVVVNFCIFRNIVLGMLRFRLGIYLFPLFHIRAAEAKAMKMRSTLNGLETMRRASLKISDFFPIKLHLRIMFLLSARLSRS